MVDREDIISRGDITRMAREADLIETLKRHEDGTVTVHIPNLSNLQRFAALVAAAEREACAKVCASFDLAPSKPTSYTIRKQVEAIRARGQE